MQATLHRAASGHLTISFNDSPPSFWREVSDRLIKEHGFTRLGPEVAGLDEEIHRDFVSPACALAAGRDNWSGYYLLSGSEAGDNFLTSLYAQIQPPSRPAPNL